MANIVILYGTAEGQSAKVSEHSTRTGTTSGISPKSFWETSFMRGRKTLGDASEKRHHATVKE